MIILRQKEYGIISKILSGGGSLVSLAGKGISAAGKGITSIGHHIVNFGMAHPILAGLGLGLLAYQHYKNRKEEENKNNIE